MTLTQTYHVKQHFMQMIHQYQNMSLTQLYLMMKYNTTY